MVFFSQLHSDSLKELLLKILEVHIYSAKSLKSRSLPLVRPLKFLDPPLSHVHYKSLTYTLSLQYRKNSKHIISLIIECALHSHLIRFNWTILSCRSQLPNKKTHLIPNPVKCIKIILRNRSLQKHSSNCSNDTLTDIHSV